MLVQQKRVSTSKSTSLWWRWLIAACLILGLVLRFVNLEGKVYQFDEAFTSLRVSGYTEAEAVQATSDQVVTVAELLKYQQINPEKTVVGTVNGLAQEEPQLTPLYFALVHAWAKAFGSSIASIRSFSALLSVLTFPCLWWLCRELFQSLAVARVAVGLMAVSPFQLLYAQEARPPMLWALTTLLSSAALLWAMRKRTIASWLIYAATLAISLYAFLFSAFMLVAHALYFLGVERVIERRPLRSLLPGLAAMALGVLAFVPWLWVVSANYHQVQSAVNWAITGKLTPVQFVLTWLDRLSLGFVDGNRDAWQQVTVAKLLFRLLDLVVLGLVGAGFWRLYRKTPPRTWLFVVLLSLIPALGVILPDLVQGGARSITPRYVVPCYLGSLLAVAYLLAAALLLSSSRRGQRFWRVTTVGVLLAGLVSCAAISVAPTWWSKNVSSQNPVFARTINTAARPLVISDAGMGDVLSLSHYLKGNVQLLVRPQCYACNFNRELSETPFLPPIPPGFDAVYLFNSRPSDTWLKNLAAQKSYRKIETLGQGYDRWFWKITP